MAEITLAEAKELLKKSGEMKEFLLTKFTKEELEGKPVPSQEEFDQFFDSLMKGLTVLFVDKNCNKSEIPTSRYQLINSEGKWVFDISYGRKPHFWLQHNRVIEPILSRYDIQYEQFKQLMKHRVEVDLGLKGIIPR